MKRRDQGMATGTGESDDKPFVTSGERTCRAERSRHCRSRQKTLQADGGRVGNQSVADASADFGFSLGRNAEGTPASFASEAMACRSAGFSRKYTAPSREAA